MSHYRCPNCGAYNTLVIDEAGVGFEYDDEVSISAKYCCCNPECQHKGTLYFPYVHLDLDDVVYDDEPY